MKDVTKIVQDAGIVSATTAVANILTKALVTEQADDTEKKPVEAE